MESRSWNQNDYWVVGGNHKDPGFNCSESNGDRDEDCESPEIVSTYIGGCYQRMRCSEGMHSSSVFSLKNRSNAKALLQTAVLLAGLQCPSNE